MIQSFNSLLIWKEVNPDRPWRTRGWKIVLKQMKWDFKYLILGQCSVCTNYHFNKPYKTIKPIWLYCDHGWLKCVKNLFTRYKFYLFVGAEN